MKKSIFLVLTILVFALSSCSEKSPIWDRDPVDISFSEGFPLEEFHRLGEARDTTAQKAMVQEHKKLLTKNVISHYPCVQTQNISFVLGSGMARNIASGDGKFYNGKFDNELIIMINDPCKKDTFFLACGNGMLSPLEFRNYSSLGTGQQCRFIIGKGQGLAHYKPQLEEWADVAGTLNIPIKGDGGKIASKQKYLNYLGKYESVLFEGDVLDVCQGKVFNRKGQEVEFQTRLAESRKANARGKK